MSAGAAVVASDLGAFRRVLEEGRAGALFRVGDSADLARVLTDLLRDDARRARLVATSDEVVRRYDWSTVTHQVLTVYEMVLAGASAAVREDPTSVRSGLDRLRRGEPR